MWLVLSVAKGLELGRDLEAKLGQHGVLGGELGAQLGRRLALGGVRVVLTRTTPQPLARRRFFLLPPVFAGP